MVPMAEVEWRMSREGGGGGGGALNQKQAGLR